jgi:hypothetical protein
LLAPRLTPRLEEHPLLFISGLVNIFAANLQLEAVPELLTALLNEP